jgi:hypothetical protein
MVAPDARSVHGQFRKSDRYFDRSVIALFFRDFCGMLPRRPVMLVFHQKAWTCEGGKTACRA